MMKIGIVTQPLKTNYGGNLQNFALQKVLIKNGFTPKTIDWATPCISNVRRVLGNIKTSFSHYLEKGNNRELLLSEKDYSSIAGNFLYFQNKYISKTNIKRSSEDFVAEAKQGNYDAFIVGSDQVWRRGYNYFSNEMFLSFTSDLDVRRISYAASFGKDNWEFSSEVTQKYSELLKKFNLVTVREKSAIALCKKHLGVEAQLVLDPTLLLEKADYLELINTENEPISKGNLFCYLLDSDVNKSLFVKKTARETGLEPFELLPKYKGAGLNYSSLYCHLEDCRYPTVTAWLRAFIDSEMTIVDSFHGMVFSVLFNKPFWVIENAHRGNTRFSSFLELVGLQNRMIGVNNIHNVDVLEPINWDIVNDNIANQKLKSLKLLFSSLQTDY